MPSIEIHNLSKAYKNGVLALDRVGFSVNGGVFGLLGHNGAGKSTLMKALVTILQPSEGTISVCGYDTNKQGGEVRARIGYLPQELAMCPSLTAYDFVAYMASLKNVYDAKKITAVLEQVDMAEYAGRKISQLSGGMRRRVGIAQALVSDPQVLVVDEPTAGLDPEERVRFRGVLSRYARDGRTVLLSTHIVEDVYQLCERLAVLRKGRLFFCGSADELMGQVVGKVKTISLAGEEQLIALQRQAVVIATTFENGRLIARIMDEGDAFPGIAPTRATLEDAYIYCMGGKDNA